MLEVTVVEVARFLAGGPPVRLAVSLVQMRGVVGWWG